MIYIYCVVIDYSNCEYSYKDSISEQWKAVCHKQRINYSWEKEFTKALISCVYLNHSDKSKIGIKFTNCVQTKIQKEYMKSNTFVAVDNNRQNIELFCEGFDGFVVFGDCTIP